MSEAIEGELAGALEEALVGVYEQDREMFDADAVAAIDALVSLWHPGDETADPEELSFWAYAAYEALHAVCEAFAGRNISYNVDGVALTPFTFEDDAPRESLSVETIAAVLLQLRQSIEIWQEQGALRGYFESFQN